LVFVQPTINHAAIEHFMSELCDFTIDPLTLAWRVTSATCFRNQRNR